MRHSSKRVEPQELEYSGKMVRCTARSVREHRVQYPLFRQSVLVEKNPVVALHSNDAASEKDQQANRHSLHQPIEWTTLKESAHNTSSEELETYIDE